ncbi:MAG: T9SS type A sorting domain-containing protein [Sphingobacteriaceae bacterium]|nr:T9SS type A sorting domain-containing protein [Sphingobacteriaceae bacterium]
MRLIFTFLFASTFFVGVTQNAKSKKYNFVFDKKATVNLSEIKVDYSPKLLVNEMPKQGKDKVENTHLLNPPTTLAKPQAAVLPSLSLGQSYQANIWGLSTPNDNDMAISDAGMAISVVNTNIHVKNTITNTVVVYKSLAAWTTPVNNLHQEFDPKVMYDPKTDRFVMVCLVGFVDTTSKVIIGFSQTNDPSGNWNLYMLPGNPLNNTLWSDYPMLSMTETEVFLTLNLLHNNQPWQTGFVETIVWQMRKENAYNGLPLPAMLHTNINLNGRPIRNLCPVKGGSKLYKPDMWFISNRNLDAQNDSVFIVHINDTIGAPGQTLTAKSATASTPYYFPTEARQTNTTQMLACNDSRNLGAFFENNMIQYVHNTNNPANSRPSIYYGRIENPSSPSPTITGYIIPNDTMDFGYPNISYAGNSALDNTSIISFDHSSDKVFGGVSAIRADGAGDYSPILRIQNGTNYVNLLQSNLERWGDYTGSQRKYANPGEVWISGYYAYTYNISYPYAHAGWVAQLALNPIFVTEVKKEENQLINTSLYPNPAKDIFSVDLNLKEAEYLSFELYDAQGKLITVLRRDWVKALNNTFSFSTKDLSAGIYILQIKGKNSAISKKVIVE